MSDEFPSVSCSTVNTICIRDGRPVSPVRICSNDNARNPKRLFRRHAPAVPFAEKQFTSNRIRITTLGNTDASRVMNRRHVGQSTGCHVRRTRPKAAEFENRLPDEHRGSRRVYRFRQRSLIIHRELYSFDRRGRFDRKSSVSVSITFCWQQKFCAGLSAFCLESAACDMAKTASPRTKTEFFSNEKWNAKKLPKLRRTTAAS